MSIIAEFRIWSSELTMSDTLDTVSDIELDLVQQTALDPDRPYGLFWAIGDNLDTFDAVLREDETVTDVACYTRFDGRALYRVRTGAEVETVIYPVWVEAGAEQIEAGYTDGWWRNRMRFPDRNALAEIEDWCLANGVEFNLRSIYTDEGRTSTPGLTAQQREVLRVALEHGYFEVPRRATLRDIAAELDISSQATSERLRRAHRQLIRDVL